jgi:hypothetical protein
LGVYDVVDVAFVVCFGFGCVIVFPISVCDELHVGVSGGVFDGSLTCADALNRDDCVIDRTACDGQCSQHAPCIAPCRQWRGGRRSLRRRSRLCLALHSWTSCQRCRLRILLRQDDPYVEEAAVSRRVVRSEVCLAVMMNGCEDLRVRGLAVA